MYKDSVKNGLLYVLLIMLVSCHGAAQQVSNAAIVIFDFNDHEIRELHQRVSVKPVSVSLVKDRFGNEASALYLHGHAHSYLNLGTSRLLKPESGTVSLWVNLERKVYAGTGYESNPIIQTKNSENPDFYDAYGLFYDFQTDRFMVFSTKDSTEQSGVNSIETVVFNNWYHMVFVYDNHHIAFYINGQLQASADKNFKTVFLKSDSVVVGNGASKKNNRYMRGVVDDIMIFNRVLDEKEINELYRAPNPNRLKNILYEILKYAAILAIIIVITMIIIARNKRLLKRQKEHYELKSRVHELEIKLIKTQMNPHFISNCLAAIQDLIYQGEVERAGQYVAKFSFFLRQILNYSDKTYISLSEELKMIRLNIELEKLRFSENFDSVIHIDEGIDTDDLLIPSLITQPFIENAIWHGLLRLKGKQAVLKINVRREGSQVCIEIEDNGAGRDLSLMQTKEHSKGTKLIIDKLENFNKLTGSSEYSVKIIDLRNEIGEPSGTRVIIHLANISE